jgi:hypothetical protein
VDTDDDTAATTINKDNEDDSAVATADEVLDADSEDNSASAATADDDLDADLEDDSTAAATADDDPDADREDDDDEPEADDDAVDDDDDASSSCHEVVATEVQAIMGNCWEFNEGQPPTCLFQFRWAGYSAKYDTYQPEKDVPASMLGPYKASRRWESLESFRKRTSKKKNQQKNTGRKRGRPVAPIQEHAPDIDANPYEVARAAKVAVNKAKLAEFLASNAALSEMAQQQPPRSYHKRNVAQIAESSMKLRNSEPPTGNGL